MKYLILLPLMFLIQGNSYSQTIIERVNVVKKEDVRLLMHLCGYRANPDLFMKSLSIQQLECMESKVSESNQIIQNADSKENRRKLAIKNIKAYDCETLSGFQKEICYIHK